MRLASRRPGARALAVPAAARPGCVTMHVRDVPLGGGRSLAAVAAGARSTCSPSTGSATARSSTARARCDGRWRPWRTADADDRCGALARRRPRLDGRRPASQFRTHGSVRRLRELRALVARHVGTGRGRLPQAGTPAIVSRTAWGADEEIVRARPVIAPALKLAVVHHTAGTNSYTRAQSAAIVRGIEVYHVRGNGWNDIGYNFLVDRFGTVYEGRGGGVDRNVVGAHAQGFNFGTVGVALIGNFSAAVPTRAQQDALVKLLAWRLDVAHVDPSSRSSTRRAATQVPRRQVVTLRAISGHRDTGPSECPGTRRTRCCRIDSRSGRGDRPAEALRAELSSGRSGRRCVSAPGCRRRSAGRSRSSTLRHRGRERPGPRRLVDWTWSSAAAGAGPLHVDDRRRRASALAAGTLGRGAAPPPAPKLSLTGLAVLPAVLAPAADGRGGATVRVHARRARAGHGGARRRAPARPLGRLLDERGLRARTRSRWSARSFPTGATGSPSRRPPSAGP